MDLGELEEVYEVDPAAAPIPEPFFIENPDEEETETEKEKVEVESGMKKRMEAEAR